MTELKIYRTPAAFKVALEDRLKKRAAQRGVLVNRVRQRFVMERLLARVARVLGHAATLKGGLALELRLSNARSTKDIDLRASGDPGTVLARLQEACALALGDHLAFAVEPDPTHHEIEDAVYEGRRFRVAATLAGQIYGSRFGVDVGMGDPMHGVPDGLVGEDFLDFVGVEPARIAAYAVETHVAEKLHAYTRPARPGRENSRVRDLPDLALLASTRRFAARELRVALETTFTFRATHGLPMEVPAPPASWAAPYAALAEENALPWVTLVAAHETVVAGRPPRRPLCRSWTPDDAGIAPRVVGVNAPPWRSSVDAHGDPARAALRRLRRALSHVPRVLSRRALLLRRVPQPRMAAPASRGHRPPSALPRRGVSTRSTAATGPSRRSARFGQDQSSAATPTAKTVTHPRRPPRTEPEAASASSQHRPREPLVSLSLLPAYFPK